MKVSFVPIDELLLRLAIENQQLLTMRPARLPIVFIKQKYNSTIISIYDYYEILYKINSCKCFAGREK